MTEQPEQPRTWRVIRHGGRISDDWRDLFAGDEEKARSRYDKTRTAMRQGGVRLIDPTGIAVEAVWAPTLRTRW